MLDVRLSREFSEWLDNLRDIAARARIVARLRRMESGNPGDVKPVGQGVSEARIDHGPGYRLYFIRRGSTIIVMLCGGDKSSQRADIARAKRMAEDFDHDD